MTENNNSSSSSNKDEQNGTSAKPRQSDTQNMTTTAPDEKALRYGWFGFTPDTLQALNTATVYAVLMSLTNVFLSGTTNGVAGVIQSSIEKRFELSSSQSSIIIVAYEIAGLPISIFITWLGTVGCHRPRWTAAAIISGGLGCWVYALPHFTTGVYMPGGDGGDGGDSYLCYNRTGEGDICEDNDGGSGDNSENLEAYIWVFVLARLLLGFSGAGVHTLSITFLDDAVTKEKFSFWSSIFATGGVIGPALGFIGGGAFLALYTDFPSLDPGDIGLEPGDPRWVGAWWLPLLVFGAFMFLLFFPMSGYPADLPGAAEIRAKKQSEAFNVTKDEIPEDSRHINFKAADIIPYTRDLLTNWTFVFLTLYICCDMSLLSAFTVYGPKYVEVMFSLPAGVAGMLFGILVVPAGALGTIGAGLIIERRQLSLYSIMRLEALISCGVVLMGPLFLIRCAQADFAGVNTPYNASLASSYATADTDTTTTLLNLTAACNMDCQCEDVSYTPVCSHQSRQFFSPCHAGCRDMVEADTDNPSSFYNCSCIPDPPAADATTPSASWSICASPSCDLIPLFAVMLLLAMLGLFMSEAMNISTIIRCMPNKQRIYGLFLSGIIVRFGGTVPGPLIFAAAFDASCLLWQESCGSRGSCFYYDTERLSYYIMGISVIVKGASVVCMVLAFWLYKPPQVVDEVEIGKEMVVGVGEQEVTGVEESKWRSADDNGAALESTKL